MSKRQCPWEEDYERQHKTHVSENRVYERNAEYMNAVYSARRAAMEPTEAEGQPGFSGASSGSNNGPSANNAVQEDAGSDVEMENVEDPDIRQGRIHRLMANERRDPSPVPSANALNRCLSHTSRLNRTCVSDVEKTTLPNKNKGFKQLTIDSFLKNQFDINEQSEETDDDEQENKKRKDSNDNDKMEQ